MTEQAGEAVPANQRSSWTSFLKSIASFSGDLSSMTAPPFILSPTSLTEYPSYWCEHPELFAAIADAKTDESRALAVLRWFISTLKGQYTSRNESMGSEKKPLNPVLGELFYGIWPDRNGRGQTNLLVEQVSHHPPITAYFIENKHKGVALRGHNAQKTTFSGGAIIVRQIGHAILTITPKDGSKPIEYLITLPRLRIDGVWYGQPYIELTEWSYISGPGYLSSIEYKGRGYFSGKSHSFKATVTVPDTEKVTHVIEGTWHESSTFKKGRSGEFHNMSSPKEEVQVRSVDQMVEFETRNLWGAVAKGIRTGDFETASREKSAIENDQRRRRKEELAAGIKWPMKHFEPIDNDPVYENLADVFIEANANTYNVLPTAEDAYVFKGNWPDFLS